MVSNDAGSYTLVKAEAAAGGAEGQPLQGYSSQRPLSTKVSGPTPAAASNPGRRGEITRSKLKRATIWKAPMPLWLPDFFKELTTYRHTVMVMAEGMTSQIRFEI